MNPLGWLQMILLTLFPIPNGMVLGYLYGRYNGENHLWGSIVVLLFFLNSVTAWGVVFLGTFLFVADVAAALLLIILGIFYAVLMGFLSFHFVSLGENQRREVLRR